MTEPAHTGPCCSSCGVRNPRDRTFCRSCGEVLARGDGAGAVLTIRFAGPQDIARVGLLSGEPGGGYTTQARPRTIELTADGRPPVTVSFDGTPGFQNRPVSLRDVTVITVLIKNAYPGQQGQAVAVRELEFLARA